MNLARPVGQADMGAVSTVSFAGLAANRALQLERANWWRDCNKVSPTLGSSRHPRPRACESD